MTMNIMLTKAEALAIQEQHIQWYSRMYGIDIRPLVAHATTAHLLADGTHDVFTINEHIPRGGSIESLKAAALEGKRILEQAHKEITALRDYLSTHADAAAHTKATRCHKVYETLEEAWFTEPARIIMLSRGHDLLSLKAHLNTFQLDKLLTILSIHVPAS
jgi:hypothetical protein